MVNFIHNINESPNSELILTTGFFDGVHCGHRYLIDYMQTIAQKENLKSAILTFWPHPRMVLHKEYQPQLLNTIEEKQEKLSQLNIDYCFQIPFTIELSNLSAYDFMKNILCEKMHVKHLIIGYDHRFGHDRLEGFDDYYRYGQELGITVSQAPVFSIEKKNISSSLIRRLLSDGEMSQANDFLGYPYSLTGEVVHGKEIGQTIGFPTANLSPNTPTKIIPSAGVYAVKIKYKEQIYNGMACIGTRPTLEKNGETSIEINIFNFNKKIYGEEITVLFYEYIRPLYKFADKEELKKSLKSDKEKVLQYFQNNP